MENEDKIFDQFKSAANKAEDSHFTAMGKVWQRVEEKLDNTKTKNATVLWKKIAVAACLLLFGTLGYEFFREEKPKTNTNQIIVANDSAKIKTQAEDAIVTAAPNHPALKKDAVEILEKQIGTAPKVAMESIGEIRSDNAVTLASPSTVNPVQSAPVVSQIQSEDNASVKTTIQSSDVEMLMQKSRKASSAHKEEPLVVIDNKVEKSRIQDIEFNDDESLIILNEPLYIINGTEYTEKEMFGPNPTSPYYPLKKQEIETISILQDEKAIEIYGEKGKKGVVVITTKNGKPVASKKAK